jgi:glycosyltransferase involved in cell wall biosynthesis
VTAAPQVVLYLSPTAEMGGAEHSLLDLVARLDRRRFQPHVLSLAGGPLLAAARRHGAGAEALPVRRAFGATSLRGARSGAAGLLAGLVAAVPAVRAARHARRRAGAAIVHSNGNKTHLVSLGVRPGSRAHVVWHVRDFLLDRSPERLLVRLANRWVAAVVANSRAVGARLERLGLESRRLHVVPNGVDPDTFTPTGPRAALREQFGWAADAPLVGIVGVLARWKGQHVFLAAAREIAARRPDARFVLVGAEIYRTRGHGDYEAELRGLVDRWNLHDVVRLTGYRPDVPDVLRALDVVVHASVEPEPFGRVIVEGLACGRPVVCTQGGGADEIVSDSPLQALQVPRGDASALARAVEALLAAPAERCRLASAGRARVQDRYHVDTHVARIVALYDTLLAGSG